MFDPERLSPLSLIRTAISHTLVMTSMVEIHVPKDILINILVRLPASSLQKLKCVNMEWFQTISDPDFAEAHLAHQSWEEFGCGFIIATDTMVLFFEGSSSANPNQPQNMKLPGAHGDTWVHGSCKGLVLFQCTSGLWKIVSLHVANPITGDKLRLPQFYGCRGSLVSASIVCSSSNNREIKVVVVGRPWKDSPLKCGVITLGSPSWREVHIPGPAFLFEPYEAPIFARGALHWKYASGILSLDLGQEKFHQTDFVFFSSTTFKWSSWLYELDECLAIVRTDRKPSDPFIKVWLLRESGWILYADMDTAFFRHVWPSYMDGDYLYFGNTIKNGKVILFWHAARPFVYLLAYDVGERVMTKFTQFSYDDFRQYKTKRKDTAKAHTSSMVSCSSNSALEKIKICGKGRIMLTSMLIVVSNYIRHFLFTINNMFQSRPN